jgi:hypothetical protein
MRHANQFFRRAHGTLTGEAENFKLALRPLKNVGSSAESVGLFRLGKAAEVV